jgi:hypothetical protein
MWNNSVHVFQNTNNVPFYLRDSKDVVGKSAIAIWDIDLAVLAAVSTRSADALSSSFFHLWSMQNNTTVIQSIIIEHIDSPSGVRPLIPLLGVNAMGSATVMAGDGTAGTGRSITMNAQALPRSITTGDFSPPSTEGPNDGTYNWAWSVNNTNTYTTNTTVAGIVSIDPNTGILTGIGPISAESNVWVFVTEPSRNIRSLGHRVTVRPYVTPPPAFELDRWEWRKENEFGINFWNDVGETNNIMGTTAGSPAVSVTSLVPSTGISLSSDGILFPLNSHLLIGTPDITPTSNTPTGFHPSGQFILGDRGQVRVTVRYTRTNGSNHLRLHINNSTQDNGTADSVHGGQGASGSSLLATTSVYSGTSAIDTIVWNIDLDHLAGRPNAGSRQALNSTFFRFSVGGAASMFTIHSILIEKIPPPALDNINITTVPANVTTAMGPENPGGSGGTISFRAAAVPVNADTDSATWVWSVRTQNDINSAVSTNATISDTGVTGGLRSALLTARHVTTDTEVFVFVSAENSHFSYPVTILEWEAAPPLTGLTLSGPNTVSAGDGTANSGSTITLSSVRSPVNANANLDWFLRASNNFDDNTAVTVAAVTRSGNTLSATIRATDTDINNDVDIWVFARDSVTEILSAGFQVTVTKYVEDVWETFWEWQRGWQTTSVTVAPGNTTTVRLNGRDKDGAAAPRAFGSVGSPAGNTVIVNSGASGGITFGANNGRLVFGLPAGIATTDTTFSDLGEFNLGTTGKLRVTFELTRTATGNINFWLNNSGTGAGTSVHSAFARTFNVTTADTVQTAVFEYDLAEIAGDDPNAARSRALASTFFQINIGSQANGVIHSILIERTVQ